MHDVIEVDVTHIGDRKRVLAPLLAQRQRVAQHLQGLDVGISLRGLKERDGQCHAVLVAGVE